MKKQQSKSRNLKEQMRLSVQILLIFVAFFLVFIVISSVNYYSAVQKSRDTIRQLTVQSLEKDVETVDRYISHVFTQTYAFLSNESVLESVPPKGSYTVDDYLRLPNLVQMLRNYQSSVSEFSDRSLFFCNTDHIFTPQGLSDFDDFLDILNRRERDGAAFWRGVLEWKDGMYLLAPEEVYYSQSSVGSAVMPLVRVRREGGRALVLATDISIPRIEALFAGSTVVEGQSILILDAQGNTLLNTTGLVIGQEQLKEFHELTESGALRIVEFRPDGGESFQLAALKGQHGLSFFTLTPDTGIRSEVNRWNVGLLPVYILLLLLLFFLTIIYARKLYNPLREMLSFMETTGQAGDEDGAKGKTTTGENDFEAVSPGFIRALLSTNSSAGCAQYQSALCAATGLHPDDLSCILLTFHFKEPFWRDFSPEQAELIFDNLPLILGSTFSKLENSYIIEYDTRQYLCFFNQGEKVGMEEQGLREAFDVLELLFRHEVAYCDVNIGISMPLSGEQSVYRAVMEASAALHMQSGQSGFSLTWYNCLEASDRPVLSQSDINKLSNQMRAGNRQEALQTAGHSAEPKEE
ncbi:MAG: hypothetical protein ACK5LX_06840 [Oscillospiraceae bacterium]